MAAEKKNGKTITIHLFKDGGDYSNDVFEYGDGKLWQIKRGVDVEVPDFIAAKIEKKLRRKGELDEMIYRKTRESEKL